MSDLTIPRFCQACGGPLLSQRNQPGQGPRWVCMRCGHPCYLDPKLAVAAVVTDPQGRILLLRRAQRDPAHGRWILPGGHMDRGEACPAATLREIAEETGLEATLEGLLGVFSYPGNPVVLVVYKASAQGQLHLDHESLEGRFFAPEDLPWDRLGYHSTGQALAQHLGMTPPPDLPPLAPAGTKAP